MLLVLNSLHVTLCDL